MPSFAASIPTDTSQWPKCPNCGLPNIPERQICKRCGSNLRQAGIPGLSVPYTEVTGTLYVSKDAHHRLFVSSHYLEYCGPSITLRTAWVNIERIDSAGAEQYLWLVAPATVTLMRSSDAASDAWLERTVPLHYFDYPTNPELRADLQRFAPELRTQQLSQPAPFPYSNIAGIVTVIAVGVPVLLIVLLTALFAKPSQEIPPLVTAVTRGNLVIAVEKTTLPNQRLYIYREQQAYYHGDSGTTLQTDPAQTYFDRTVRPTPTAADTFTATLSADEWQTLDAWWDAWCRTRPTEISDQRVQPAYRIALRCGLMTGSLFTVAPETLPPAVRTIFLRATNNAYL